LTESLHVGKRIALLAPGAVTAEFPGEPVFPLGNERKGGEYHMEHTVESDCQLIIWIIEAIAHRQDMDFYDLFQIVCDHVYAASDPECGDSY